MLPSVRFHKFRFGALGVALVFMLGFAATPGLPDSHSASTLQSMAKPATTPTSAPIVTVDGVLPNLFYGATPAVCASATSCPTPVLVFVHGLSGSYADWLESANCPGAPTPCGPNNVGTGNDMYDYAYANGFRTAFMSLSANNSGNSASIQTNAAMLETIFPRILANFGVSKVYFVCHSKGGLDLQAALATPQWIGIANAVLMLGTPNQGDALATWLFNTPNGQTLGGLLGLLTPAVQSMEIANVQQLRAQWDPIFENASIPFYTVAGDICTSAGYPNNTSAACKNTTTGVQLLSITGGASAPPNDELVTEPETILPLGYSMSLGVELQNHYQLRLGDFSFNMIYSRVMAQENQVPGFVRVATNGFGDAANTEAWSMAWFNGQLYVGTGREVYCVTNADAAIEAGLPGLYPPAVGNCTSDFHHLPLQAEIWQYTPQTDTWVRVFQSPNSLTTTDNTGATVATAREMGIRSLTLVTEPGTPPVTALYAGTVTSGAIFEANHTVGGWPPPRILRSVDGVTWTALPQDPGTFLGDISQASAQGASQEFQVFGIRSGGQLNGVLYLQVGDFSGVGQVIGSLPGSNPSVGNNNYQYASPPASTLPVWILQAFNGFMYAGTGNPYSGSGPPTQYGVWKTTGVGTAPYTWIPIITQGAFAQAGSISNYAMSFEIFPDSVLPGGCPATAGTVSGGAGGCLYVGTDQPSEMVRIHPDTTGNVLVYPGGTLDSNDSWDLVVGNPRTIPTGVNGAGTAILPISGIGQYFDNGFTGHFWRMGVGGMGLYMSTFDSSGESTDDYNTNGAAENWSQEYGTDLFRSPDGIHWTALTRVGFGDGMNTGGRTFQETPFGLFWGTARPAVGGTQVFMIDNTVMDYNHDGVIDQKDVNLMTARIGSKALPKDPMDLNQDGMITRADLQLLTTQCAFPKCAVQAAKPASAALGVPVLHSAPGALGGNVSLDWPVASGAADYLVYRINMSPNATTPPSFEPLAAACSTNAAALLPSCDAARANQSVALIGFPGPVTFVTRVTASGPTATFTETPPTTNLQLLYFVRSEDSFGNLSAPSNLVGAPSYAAQ
jgi:hypothetical protein